MAKKTLEMPIISVDKLFTTQEERDNEKLETIKDLKLSDINDFPNHPFKVLENADMQEMVDSVKQYGVLSPALVRVLENGTYQMIAGHRRKRASELAGKDTLPCIIKHLTDEEATIIMVDSNLQREHILPSERAFAYKMKLEAMKHQGKRNDLTSDQVGEKLTSIEKLSINSPDSKSQIQRYIRLTELIKPLLDMVDNEDIALSPGYEISFLTKEEQKWLLNSIECNVATPTVSQAQEMRNLSKDGNLDEDKIEEIMSREKPNQVITLKINVDNLKSKMPKNIPPTEYTDYIFKALDYYKKHLEKQKKDRER